ncbi:MAG: S-layer homology domain-containing protein, partial [Andreesenia angusta]|nr:S-layer homology domain-containing protein [Andreesenia angusta]
DKPVNPDKPSDNDDILTNKVALDLAIRLADDIRLSDQYEYITGYPKKLFDKKLGNAKRVYNDSNATNYEILLAASELNSAISQLLLSPSIPVTPEKPSEPEKPILPDVKPEDRIYSVPVKMLMATNDNESMANKVIDKKAFIVEKSNGKSEVYLDFKTLYMENIDLYGNLLKLWHYPGKPEDSSGNIPEAIVVKNRIGKASVEVSKGKFEVKDTELPGRFKLIRDKKREETIYVKVEVDAMEEIAKSNGEDNGHQNARVILDWSKAEDITDTNSNLPTEPVNPDNDKKPDSNNTKPDQPSKEKYKAYTVPVKLMKAYENTASMGNGAVIPKAKIVEKDGKSHIYIDMKGLEFMNMKGHLLRLWSYPNGVTEDKSGLVEAKIVERKEDTGLGGKVDKYPSKFEIIRDKSKEEEIGVRVKVDAMAEIDGSGEQNARLVFDWSKAEEIEGGIELPDNNNNDKPSNKYDSEVIYIDGYKDGTFKPDNAISRAEATKILAYALTKEYSKEKNYGNSFNDIKSDAWYAKVVGYMQEIKAINGYEDGSFRADNPITRGEFAKIVALIDGHKANNANKFTDVPKEHWAKPYIEDIGAKGYIKGYPNGDFGADNNITRAEVVAIVNRMIGKDIESFKGKDNLNKFSDMNNNHWAYLDIIAATNK